MTQQSETTGAAVARLQRRNRRVRVVLWTVFITAVLGIAANIALVFIMSNREAPEHYRDAAIGRTVPDQPRVKVRARVVEGDRRHLVNRVYEFAQGNARPRYDDATDPGAELRHILYDLSGDQAAVLSLLDSRPYHLSPWYRSWPGPAPADHPYDAGPYTMELKITEMPPYPGVKDLLLSLMLTCFVAALASSITGWCYFDRMQQDEWLRDARRADETFGAGPDVGSYPETGRTAA